MFIVVLSFFLSGIVPQSPPRRLKEEFLHSQEQQVEGKKDSVKSPSKTPNAATAGNAQQNNSTSHSGEPTMIYLENSELMSYNSAINPDVQVLKGNVIFRHDNALMYCDSAYFYEKANSFDAFGNVHINQADTLFGYGDFLYYNGNTRLAKFRQNVRLENQSAVVTTDSMNYDRIANLVYYYTGGKIKDELNELTSVWGQYSPSTNVALFRDSVHLVNPNFTMNADTLRYNTETNVANIVGPTHIIYNDETDIFSNLGWYNTSNERSMLLNRSLIVHQGGKTMIGDTIFYDKMQKYGEAFSRVVLTDSVQMSTLYGNYIFFNELEESGLATDSALLVDWSGENIMYVHSDTIRTLKDSIHDVALAYYGVRMYRDDIQGICDSIVYSSKDSIVNMYGEPVVWAQQNQLSGNFIQAYIKNDVLDRIVITRPAVASQQVDSIHFNQLSGNEMTAFVTNNELKRVFVSGNAETIYYPVDDADSTIIAINKTESSFVNMYFIEKELDRIVLTDATNGGMFPIDKFEKQDLYLRNFFWLPEHRPKNKDDVFVKLPKSEREKPGAASGGLNAIISSSSGTQGSSGTNRSGSGNTSSQTNSSTVTGASATRSAAANSNSQPISGGRNNRLQALPQSK